MEETIAIKETLVAETNNEQVLLTGPALFETSEEATREFFKENGYIKGRAPLIQPDTYTENKNRYLNESVAHLERDIGRILVSKNPETRRRLLVKFEGSPWPPGVMYPSHKPAKDAVFQDIESPDLVKGVASRITGTYRENGMFGITFETLPTSTGKDTAVLLMEGLIQGVSLRGLPLDFAVNERGGKDVKKFRIETFGADFTHKPAMPGASGITLESQDANDDGASGDDDQPSDKDGQEDNDLKAEDIKTLEDLKGVNVALFESVQAEIASGKDAATALEEAKTKLQEKDSVLEAANEKLKKARIVLAKSASATVISKYKTEVLDKDKALSDASRARLFESGKQAVETAALALLESRPELDPDTQGFADALYSEVQPVLESRCADLKTMVAEELKARKINTDAPDPNDPNVDVVTEGMDGLNAPNMHQVTGGDRARLMLIESENEMTGLPRAPHGKEPIPCPMKDAILSRAFGMPMWERDEGGNPIHVIDKYMPEKRQAVELVSEAYAREPGLVRVGAGYFNLNDMQMRAHPQIGKLFEKLQQRVTLEANEMQTLATLGALFPDFRQGIIEAAFAMSKWLTMVTIQPTGSPEYQIWEEEYERTGQHFFGELAQAALVTTIDEGAVTRPARVYVEIKTQYDANETITLTGLDGAGLATQTWTVDVLTTDAVGVIKEAMPNQVGAMCKDVTSAVDTNTATAGEVKIFVYDEPDAGAQTELVVSQNAKGTLVRRTGTVGEYDLEVEMTWRTIEDALRSLATTGPGRYDVAAAMTRMVSRDFAGAIDGRGFTGFNNTANFDSQLVDTLNIPGTDAKADLHEKLVKLNEKILFWGHERPTRLAINEGDTHKLLWIKDDLITRFQNRAEAFFSGMSWGVVAGMAVVDCHWQPRNVMMAANPSRIAHISYIPLEFRGPFSYVGSQKTEVFVGRMRTEDVFTKPRTRGKLTITE